MYEVPIRKKFLVVRQISKINGEKIIFHLKKWLVNKFKIDTSLFFVNLITNNVGNANELVPKKRR